MDLAIIPFSEENPLMLNFSILHKVVNTLGQINKNKIRYLQKCQGKVNIIFFGLIHIYPYAYQVRGGSSVFFSSNQELQNGPNQRSLAVLDTELS